MTTSDSGETTAFEALYRAQYPKVAGYLGRRLVADVVDDAISEVFMIAWRRRADLPSEPTGWLIGVAANVVAQHYRAKSRFERLVDEERSRACRDGRSTTEPDVVQRLTTIAALEQLAPTDREAILLVAWDGLSTAEAAGAMACSPGAFRVRLTRARARLRAALDQLDEVTETTAGAHRD